MARNRKASGTVRIIGGEWRGRRLPVADIAGLRPSGDRARETLFNWLQPHLRGARCADLFAGTGVLGLEAASRGAAEVTLVEKSARAAASLRETIERLGDSRATLWRGDALTWLESASDLDIVFVDPPFESALQAAVLDLLHRPGCLSDRGLVYVEWPRLTAPLSPPTGWIEVRSSTLGEVKMQLLRKSE